MECLLVIDSSYSHTTITPIFNGRAIQRAIRRLDFGGKHLTNLLKEIISVRYFDLHQDTKIVNDIKEDTCFVSRDLKTDMEKTWKGNKGRRKHNSITNGNNETDPNDKETTNEDARLDYVLPDGIHILRGYSMPHDSTAAAARKRKLNATAPESEASMTLGNERFAVPEIVFRPSDIGSKQPGLADCVLQSLAVLPQLVQATMLSNVLVVEAMPKCLDSSTESNKSCEQESRRSGLFESVRWKILSRAPGLVVHDLLVDIATSSESLASREKSTWSMGVHGWPGSS